jgi:hypothetical protein
MEKYLDAIRMQALLKWMQLKRWFYRVQYRLLLLAFIALLAYHKDWQLTIGANGFTIADFRAVRTISGWMPSSSIEEAGNPNDAAISWSDILKEEKPASSVSAPAPKAVKLPNASTERQQQQLDYAKRFGKVAQLEMQKYGIPASITLAQGILESNSGGSALARLHNNHFGIKCQERSCPKGHCVNYHDDSPKDFFRKYGSAWESFRSHSEFLQRERYQSLKKLGPRDYKGWAKGLEKAGYATGKGYGNKLIRLIEDLKLYEFDK